MNKDLLSGHLFLFLNHRATTSSSCTGTGTVWRFGTSVSRREHLKRHQQVLSNLIWNSTQRSWRCCSTAYPWRAQTSEAVRDCRLNGSHDPQVPPQWHERRSPRPSLFLRGGQIAGSPVTSHRGTHGHCTSGITLVGDVEKICKLLLRSMSSFAALRGMNETRKYRGRMITDADVAFIRQLIAAHPTLSRRALSQSSVRLGTGSNPMVLRATWCAAV